MEFQCHHIGWNHHGQQGVDGYVWVQFWYACALVTWGFIIYHTSDFHLWFLVLVLLAIEVLLCCAVFCYYAIARFQTECCRHICINQYYTDGFLLSIVMVDLI